MKQKTKSALKKRIKVTGSGKIMLQKAARNHLLSSKSKRQKKANRLGQEVSKGAAKNFARMAGLSRS